MDRITPLLRLYNLIIGFVTLTMAYILSGREIETLFSSLTGLYMPAWSMVLLGYILGTFISVVVLNEEWKSLARKWIWVVLGMYVLVSTLLSGSGDINKGIYSTLYGLFVIGIFILFLLAGMMATMGVFLHRPSFIGISILLALIAALLHVERGDGISSGLTLGILIILWSLGVFTQDDYSVQRDLIKEGEGMNFLERSVLARFAHAGLELSLSVVLFYFLVWSSTIVGALPEDIRESIELRTHYANLFLLFYVTIVLWLIAMITLSFGEWKKKVLLLGIYLKQLYAKGVKLNVPGRRGTGKGKAIPEDEGEY